MSSGSISSHWFYYLITYNIMKVAFTKKYEILSLGKVFHLSLEEIFKKSEKTLLYFYPKDNTPWCTMEAKDFTCLKKEFDSLWIKIVGVSRDSIDAHSHFITSESLDIDLISDPDLELHKELWVYGEKNNYGKIIMGVIRSTFLFDADGKIVKEWRNVKATGHVEKILKELKK